MVHAVVTLLAAAEAAVEEEEKSKTAFYVAGCLFGAWAIALFFIGQRAPAFPGNSRTAVGLGITSVILAITCAGLAIYLG